MSLLASHLISLKFCTVTERISIQKAHGKDGSANLHNPKIHKNLVLCGLAGFMNDKFHSVSSYCDSINTTD